MGLFGSKKTGKNAKENKKENPLNVPKTAQDSIPYQGVYENGIIQINENFSAVPEWYSHHLPEA